MGQGQDAKPGGFRCAESTREEEPTSWARAAVELQVLVPQAALRAHLSCPQVSPVYRMRPPVPSAPLALWVLGCFSLLLWLWALCTACHRYVPEAVSTLSTYGSARGSILGLGQDLPLPTGLTALLPLGSGLRGNKLGCRAV